MEREVYALAYQRDSGIARWVSWHLTLTDFSPAQTDRYSGNFIVDPTISALGWSYAMHSDYTNTGYDCGHLTPSGDRLSSDLVQRETFYLANIVPQAPDNNQGPWRLLEEHTRNRVRAGNEAYVIGGTIGSNGTIGNGKIVVPADLWKVVVVLPEGDNDLARINAETEVVAVIMPNINGLSNDWTEYRSSIACIEQRTGLDLLSNVAPEIQAALAGPPCSTSTNPQNIFLPLVIGQDNGTNEPTPTSIPPTVRITYIECNPPSDDVMGEYVRIVNEGTIPVDLTDWILRDCLPIFCLTLVAACRYGRVVVVSIPIPMNMCTGDAIKPFGIIKTAMVIAILLFSSTGTAM
ncbi:MAG: hypothetical protein C0184_08675 [Chloroflexus aggregans]|uniref:DNA/RNA non-specific endonuclease n=1 Tax=Chloroflexus aggregans TaxID=152260 RepID=A0A2J6X476_9CHLR|nr:MAG: hypothetical protein C0184_08675 [Chloroflexus aggregans]